MFALIGNLGWTEVVLIILIALIVFGPTRLPELAKSIGKGLREFRKAARGIEEEINRPVDEIKSAIYQQGEEVAKKEGRNWTLTPPRDETKHTEKRLIEEKKSEGGVD